MDEISVKKTVESIVTHGLNSELEDFGGARIESDEADKLEKELEAQDIAIEEDPGDIELLQVKRGGQPWLIFHVSEWAWKEANGKWPWEAARTESPLFSDPDDLAKIRVREAEDEQAFYSRYGGSEDE